VSCAVERKLRVGLPAAPGGLTQAGCDVFT
jgi:hypothetical protein